MKKNYLLFSLIVFLSIGINAQNFTQLQSHIVKNDQTASSDNFQLKAGGDTIYTNSFNNSGDWTIGAANIQGQWEWVTSTPPLLDQYMGTMASTTASNGFAAFNGVQYLITPPVELQDATIELTSAIDLSTFSGVSIKFEQRYRAFNYDQTFLELSNDNGSTWQQIELNASVQTNATAVQNTININVSSYIGSAAQAKIRFRWQTTSDDDAFGSGYGWMIDDLELYETYQNDLVITNYYFGSLNLPYYQIPDEQVTAIDFSANVSNNGGADQNSTTLSIDVNSGTFSGTSSSVTITSGNSDSLACTTQYTPSSSLGTHTLTWTVASDSIDELPSDNTASESIEVTDFIYARDKGTITGGWGNQGEAFELGNYFDAIVSQDLTYIDFIVSSTSNPGAVVYGVLYSVDAATGDFIWEGNTDDYILTSNDVNNNNTISLPLFVPFSLTAGETYLVCAGAYGDGGATNDFRCGTSGLSDTQTSFLYDGTDLTWYYVTSTPMVRMNFDPSWGIIDNSDLNVNLGQNHPNPFDNNTLINVELNSPNQVTFEITDVTGKIVRKSNFGNLGAGSHQINISADGLKSGVYFYSIVSDNNKLTKKMIIQK